MTIKEQLWQTIQAEPDIGIEDLGKRYGLNGHDLAKNLEQIAKEGRIKLRWKGNRMVGLRLKTPSIEDRVWRWVRTQPAADMGAWVEATPNSIRDELGMSGNQAGVAISNMIRVGKVEVRRDGRNINAVRIPLNGTKPPIVIVDEKTGNVSTTTPPTVTTVGLGELRRRAADPVTMPDTPNLDAYFSARRIARLAPEHNPYLTIEFTENPIAEEALVLRERLTRALGGG